MSRLLRILLTTVLAACALVALTATTALAQADAAPSTWALRLDLAGGNRLEVVARVRAIAGLGVKEANDLVLSAPVVVKRSLSRTDADLYADQLRQVGATVSVIVEEPASAPTPSGPPQVTPAAPDEPAFAVRLEAEGPTRVEVVKRVKVVTKLGLKESDDLVKAAPTLVLDALTRSSADAVAAYLREAGATVQVTSAAPPAPAPSAPSRARETKRRVHKATYRIVLQGYSDKTAAMTAVRQVTGLGVKEVKALVESLPAVVRSGLGKTDADVYAQKLRDAGGTIAIELDR